jgi:hypothetical protein
MNATWSWEEALGFVLMLTSGAVICSVFSWAVLIGFILGIVQAFGAALFVGQNREGFE